MKKERVMVCGGGHQGLSMAAHLAMSGVETTLWNRTREHIRTVIEEGCIKSSGVVNGIATPFCVSDTIEDTIADVIMVTTPSIAIRDIAKKLVPYMDKKKVVVLNPGRTFGAVEFADTLIKCGIKELPHIAETQSIVYTCRRDSGNTVEIFALKNDIKIASLQGDDIDYIMEHIPNCIRRCLTPVSSIMETSMSNVGMILHCAPVLMNVGWIESPNTDFKYYYDGISRSVATFLEKMDAERVKTAKSYGCNVETVAEWLRRIYNSSGDNLFECIRSTKPYNKIDAPTSIYHRYVLEDIPCGLVPVESLADRRGIDTKNISIIIDLASSVYDIDFRKDGRNFDEELLSLYIKS